MMQWRHLLLEYVLCEFVKHDRCVLLIHLGYLEVDLHENFDYKRTVIKKCYIILP